MTGVAMAFLLNKPTVQTFLVGIFVGLSIGLITTISKKEDYSYYGPFDIQYVRQTSDYARQHSKNDTHHRMLNSTIADQLYDEVKVLCWVLTGPANHRRKAQHVKNTWGKRCKKLIFMSSQADPDLPAVGLQAVQEGRPYLWGKTKQALKYLYKHHYNEYDWFFKADDDTYAVMENLRYLLYYANATDPVYFGCRLKGRDKEDFASGGAGYVLSKEALKRFVKDSLPNKTACKQADTGDEDVELGKCLKAVGVDLGDSLDNEHRHRFTPLFVNSMLIPGFLNEVAWYMDMMYNSADQGFSCCSDNLITTHYVSPHLMYLLEYLIYHVTPFGIAYHPTLVQEMNKHNGHYRKVTNEPEKVTEPSRWEDFN